MCTVVFSSFVSCSCVSSAVVMYSSELRKQLHIQMFITLPYPETLGIEN